MAAIQRRVFDSGLDSAPCCEDADEFLASMRADEIEGLLDDLMTVVTQREELRSQVQHLLPVVLRLTSENNALYRVINDLAIKQAEDSRTKTFLANVAAEQTLLNQELRERLAWYRRLLHEEGYGAIGRKRAQVLAGHRLNSES